MKLNTTKINTYLRLLASAKPVPGGGSASALVAAVGIALAEMVANIILKRKLPLRKPPQLKTTAKRLAQFRVKVEEVIDKDARVYARLRRAYSEKTKLNQKYISDCLYESFDVMVLLVSLIGAARRELTVLEKCKSKSLLNDLLLSKVFLDASFKGAFATAKINYDYMPDKKRKQTMQTLLKALQFKFKHVKKKHVMVKK
ncbi:MAG: cyclodeaminase/cyclohydrolase family protein [Candidatus Omnitrophica bacterium]|nr:cyclodeaminase/cyclohydrolase family protein [Candidatus Omnitrophota bacterium]